MNGTPVFEDLDLAGEHGRYVAVERRVLVRAEVGSRSSSASTRRGESTISGIELRRP